MQVQMKVPPQMEVAIAAIEEQKNAEILAVLTGNNVVNCQAPLSEVTPSTVAIIPTATTVPPVVDEEGHVSVEDEDGPTPATELQLRTVVTAKASGYTIKPDLGLDAQKMPWCKEIHSSGKAIDKGTQCYRRRKNLDDAVFAAGVETLCSLGFGLNGAAPQVGVDTIPVVTPAVAPVPTVAAPAVVPVPPVTAPAVPEVPVVAAPVATPPVVAAPVVVPVPVVTPVAPEAPAASSQVGYAQVLDLVSKKQASQQWTPEIAAYICSQYSIEQIHACNTVADMNGLHALILQYCPDPVA